MSSLQPSSVNERAAQAGHFDVVVVGAGFAGLYTLFKLRKLGLTARAFEQGSDVGGTWYWNRYPGARCDIESMQYSYSFDDELQQEWQWSERYAPQPEILKYANYVADKYKLRSDIQLNTRVASTVYNEDTATWAVTTDDGKRYAADYVIMATGSLSNARIPDFKGLSRFKGKTYHTGHWPHEGVNFTGKRVGVVGTGSSAIQSIPVIAEQAAHLYVFQRTPNFSIPAHNRELTEDYRQSWKSDYPELRRRAREETKNGVIGDIPTKGALDDSPEDRQHHFESKWQRGGTSFMGSYNNLALSKEANDTASDFVRAKIAGIVKDPKIAKLLQPTNHPIGTKRICVDTNYYATYNRPNVTLVDIKNAPIDELTEKGLITGGKEFELDAIVFATGFDAMTGSFAKVDIRGRDGLTLKHKWEEGPKTYLGVMSAGFPNLFIITGPGSPSVLSNMIVSIEQHVDWITDCIAHLRTNAIDSIEATQIAEDNWVAHVNEVAFKTLYPQANSWYMGANIPGKPQVFMPYIGGVHTYRQICNDVVAKGYEGFAMIARRQASAAE